MEIHEKLKFMRMFKGWSQEDMARKIELSVNGYAKIERGEADISISRLRQLAEVLGIDMAQLFGLSEKNIFNVIEGCTNVSHGNVVLSETQCAQELERFHLLLQERDKEIGYLKEENSQLKEIIELLKKDHYSQ